MGYRPEPTIYKLDFDQSTGLDGLFVRVKCCTMKEFNDMLRGSNAPELKQLENIDEDDPAALTKLMALMQDLNKVAADANESSLQLFLKYVVEWDLEGDDGKIVPLTMEGIGTVEKPVIGKIISAWHTAMMAVPRPLKSASANGRRSEEATLGMESISESLGNLPKHNSSTDSANDTAPSPPPF